MCSARKSGAGEVPALHLVGEALIYMRFLRGSSSFPVWLNLQMSCHIVILEFLEYIHQSKGCVDQAKVHHGQTLTLPQNIWVCILIGRSLQPMGSKLVYGSSSKGSDWGLPVLNTPIWKAFLPSTSNRVPTRPATSCAERRSEEVSREPDLLNEGRTSPRGAGVLGTWSQRIRFENCWMTRISGHLTTVASNHRLGRASQRKMDLGPSHRF